MDETQPTQQPLSYIGQLVRDLEGIEALMMDLLDVSTIKRFVNDPSSMFFVVAPEYYWGEPDERQQVLQMKLKEQYATWYERFQLLFEHAAPELSKRIRETHKFVTDWIEKNSSWVIPPTISQSKEKFKEMDATYFSLLRMMAGHAQEQPVLVPDTNALIAAPDLAQYVETAGTARYTVTITPTVTDELDKLKVTARDNAFREKVNSVIRRLKGLRQQGNMLAGVTVNKTVTVKMVPREPNFAKTLSWLDPSNNDDRVIASMLEIQCAHPSACVILVTSDINLQNKAEMAGIPYREPPSELEGNN